VNTSIKSLFARFVDLWPTLMIRFQKGPLNTVEGVVEFIQTRAAYVAQTSLYGYLKTRMGMKYAAIFQDDAFAPSLAIAKWNVFVSCLSDLTIFAVATAVQNIDGSEVERASLANHCFTRAARNTIDDPKFQNLLEESIANFSRRTQRTNWQKSAIGENAFWQSPEDVVRFAPILSELKELDEQIVVNSTRFRWRDVREQLRKRIDGKAVVKDWLNIKSTGLDPASNEPPT